MAILDRQGRLFGKVSLLDLGVLSAILLTLAGLLLVPGNGGYSIAQIVTAENKPIELDTVIRGLSAKDPQQLVQVGDKVDIIIRNQPRGQVTVKAVEIKVPKDPLIKPDGTVISVPDPRATETYQADLIVTVVGNAKITSDGVVVNNEKMKVGTSIDLESAKYVLRGSAIAIRY